MVFLMPPPVRDGLNCHVYRLSGAFFVVSDLLHGCADRGCCVVRVHRGDLGFRDQQFRSERKGAKKVRRFRLLRFLSPPERHYPPPACAQSFFFSLKSSRLPTVTDVKSQQIEKKKFKPADRSQHKHQISIGDTKGTT